MAKKTSDYTELTFYIAADENGVVRGDDDAEGARERLMDNTEGDCCDVWAVTVKVPKARIRKVHLGAITVAEEEATITAEAIEAA